jgi:2-keto-3-deoxy-L-rhamnonate aldolase RhmA
MPRHAPVTVGRLNRGESYFARYRRQMNAIKDSIKSGKTVVGTTAGPNVDVSILADAGYDFLLFDTQHSAWEIKQLRPSIEAMRGKQAAPLVRVAANQAYQICFALDAGARGIVVPMVNTRAEAEAAVPAAIIRLATAATLGCAANGASSRITAITSML